MDDTNHGESFDTNPGEVLDFNDDDDPMLNNEIMSDESITSNDDNLMGISVQKQSCVYLQAPQNRMLQGTVYNISYTDSALKELELSSSTNNVKSVAGRNLGDFLNRLGGIGGDGNGGNGKDEDATLQFEDCGGLEKQVAFLKTAVLGPLTGGGSQNPERFGNESPKGILFYGPPGTGKTRIAQSLCNEVKKVTGRKVNFIIRKGNDVASQYFGQTEANLRKVFAEAKEKKPCILFFDELDGLCPSRDTPFISEAYISIVTTMLGMMDELPKGEVFVIGATNRVDAIDPALRRPGRFDKHLEFLPPSENGRLDILKIHTSNWKVKPAPNWLTEISHQTEGFSGADLAKLCLDAFDQALDRLIPEESSFSPQGHQFDGLTVEMKDWELALQKMRASNSAIFGSTLYIPKKVGDYIEPLLRTNVQRFREVLEPLLLTNSESQSSTTGVNACYFWSEQDGQHFDRYMMPFLLKSPAINNCSIYTISPELLYSAHTHEWSQIVRNAFSQAMTSQKQSILYIQKVDELWELINNAGLETAVDFTHHLERLRAAPVVLLAFGSSRPTKLRKDNNPFRNALGECANILPLSKDDASSFLRQFFDTIHTGSDEELWTDGHTETLEVLIERAETSAEGQDLEKIVILFDTLTLELAAMPDEELERGETVTKKIIEVIGSCI